MRRCPVRRAATVDAHHQQMPPSSRVGPALLLTLRTLHPKLSAKEPEPLPLLRRHDTTGEYVASNSDTHTGGRRAGGAGRLVVPGDGTERVRTEDRLDGADVGRCGSVGPGDGRCGQDGGGG